MKTRHEHNLCRKLNSLNGVHLAVLAGVMVALAAINVKPSRASDPATSQGFPVSQGVPNRTTRIQQGEILLTGDILSVDAASKTIKIRATSFQTATGGVGRVDNKEKIITVDADSKIYRYGAPDAAISLSAIPATLTGVKVIGTNLPSNKLEAREVILPPQGAAKQVVPQSSKSQSTTTAPTAKPATRTTDVSGWSRPHLYPVIVRPREGEISYIGNIAEIVNDNTFVIALSERFPIPGSSTMTPIPPGTETKTVTIINDKYHDNFRQHHDKFVKGAEVGFSIPESESSAPSVIPLELYIVTLSKEEIEAYPGVFKPVPWTPAEQAYLASLRDISKVPLASPEDIAVKTASNHPIAAEGYSIPANLKDAVGLLTPETLKRSPNREYHEFERIMLFDINAGTNPHYQLIPSEYRPTRDHLEGNTILFPRNTPNGSLLDPLGSNDTDSFYLTSITVWNETKNEPVVGTIVTDRTGGMIGLRLKADPAVTGDNGWDYWKGQTISIRVRYITSQINADLISQLRPETADGEIDLARVPRVAAHAEKFPSGGGSLNSGLFGVHRKEDPKDAGYEPDFEPLAEKMGFILSGPEWEGVPPETKALEIMHRFGKVARMKSAPRTERGTIMLNTGVLKGEYGDCGSFTACLEALFALNNIPCRTLDCYISSNMSHAFVQFPTPYGVASFDMTGMNYSLRGKGNDFLEDLVEKQATYGDYDIRHYDGWATTMPFDNIIKTESVNSPVTFYTTYPDNDTTIAWGSLDATRTTPNQVLKQLW